MRTILIADKDNGIRNMVRLLFTESMGYKVVATPSGADAVSKAKKIKPDIVISDIYLSDKNGYQVSREIKNNLLLKNTSVLLLTSAFATFDKRKVAEAYADDFIVKPFESEEIIKKVESLTHRKKYRSKLLRRPKRKNIFVIGVVVLFAILMLTIPILSKVFDLNPFKSESKLMASNEIERKGSMPDIKEASVNKPYFIKNALSHYDPEKLDGEEVSRIEEIRATQPEKKKASEEVKEDELISHTEVRPDAMLLENERRKKKELDERTKPTELSKTRSIRKTKRKQPAFREETRVFQPNETTAWEKPAKTDVKEKIVQEELDLTHNQERSKEAQAKLTAKHIEQSSVESTRFKLWNSNRTILGLEGGNVAVSSSQEKGRGTQKQPGNYSSDIKITGWSFYVPWNGVAIIHNVTIENKSNTTYKDIKVRLRYYSRDGIEVSRVAGILPVVVPPHTKITYLKGGSVLGAGSSGMDARNIEVLGATPVHDN